MILQSGSRTLYFWQFWLRDFKKRIQRNSQIRANTCACTTADIRDRYSGYLYTLNIRGDTSC